MAIYQDVGHKRESAIPISLIPRAKRHSARPRNTCKIQGANSVTLTYFLRTRPPSRAELAAIFPRLLIAPRVVFRSLAGEQPNYRNARCLSSLPSWSDGDDIAPGHHTRT